jgi:hypothetical protein
MNPVKKFTSRLIDNAVLDAIDKADLAVARNFRKWYRSTLSSAIIVGCLLVAGVLHSFFTDSGNFFRLAVAVAYLVSIGIFVKRRIMNVRSLKKNWPAVKKYAPLAFSAFTRAQRGGRLRSVGYAVYQSLYEEKAPRAVKKVHSVAAFLRAVPDKDETFDIVWRRMVEFARNVVSLYAVRYVVFIALFTAISVFVKNSVLLEMRFSNIFETVAYPFLYFYDLIAGLFR